MKNKAKGSPVKAFVAKNIANEFSNMTKTSEKLIGKTYYKKNSDDKNEYQIEKLSDSKNESSQLFFKYSNSLLGHVSHHLHDTNILLKETKEQLKESDLSPILNLIKDAKDFVFYQKEINKNYTHFKNAIKEGDFIRIKALVTKTMDLEYLNHLLTQITKNWIDITYGSNEQNDIKNLVITGFSAKQLELAAITIAANKNVIFQNPKFLNYILEYANSEEKKEFAEINNVFKFLPQSKIDFSDLPSKVYMTKEEVHQEIEIRKQSIIKEVSIIIDNQEKLMNLLSAAVEQEDKINEIHQQAEERLKEIEDEKVKEITELKQEFEKQVEKKAEELKQVYELRERTLSEQFNEQLVKTEQEYKIKIFDAEKAIEVYEEKIKVLEIDRLEYLKAKERIEELVQQERIIQEEHLALKIKVSKYEEAEKNKLISEEEIFKVSLLDFDDEEDDGNLIQEKGLLEDQFISNNDHNIMDNLNKGLVGENYISTNEFNLDQD